MLENNGQYLSRGIFTPRAKISSRAKNHLPHCWVFHPASSAIHPASIMRATFQTAMQIFVFSLS
jgi:hypothetical protein